eukprot:CAMPEP_0206220452 /NCGR_PEP_ID=MMETSP0047_2-20121206/4885_1 /ASSEMBLY_ACC=CAM_ASM_000192 /TAXON_ID=195065 /ORGANISM="Chroomonas mesostigmatica_cf, Strain CCMP1168" /LENGTH=60 /DNA_ID=CAMNT_0053643113 /DNA_START=69 /DNA_END=248 /DNA_ORIENTATION=-
MAERGGEEAVFCTPRDAADEDEAVELPKTPSMLPREYPKFIAGGTSRQGTPTRDKETPLP